MHTDYLIVGQGLAGSLLAWELIRRKCKVVIVDSAQENASQVAAGLINPVTGQRFVKSADMEVLLPAAKAYYAALSDFFQRAFYLEKPMLRIFRSDAEASAGLQRLKHPAYQAYLSAAHLPPHSDLISPFGVLQQQQTGHLLTTVLLDCLKGFFIAQGCYQQLDFNHDELQTHPVLRWRDIVPQHIIFCEGYHVAQNPWFSWLPLQPVKGEILTLHTATLLPDTMLNYGNWLLPLEAHCFRVGATFDRENINTLPTEQGKDTLMNNLKLLSAKLSAATLIRHQANIRPCSADRKPLIGRHPQQPRINIFNGFGAKGSLQIPWFSQQFADVLLQGSALAKSCNVERYYASHFSW